MKTVWVFGDQLNRRIGALAGAEPGAHRILLVESDAMNDRGFHRQRLHLVLTAMRRFGAELSSAGFEVDHRRAATLTAGLEHHVADHSPDEVLCTEPNGRALRDLVARLDVRQVESNQFLTHPNEFAEWADGRDRLRMEDFYRWQRRRLDILMDGDAPIGGRWNLDHENREPPPDDPPWPRPPVSRLDEVDEEILDGLPDSAVGADPEGWWPTSRRAALARLRHFVDEVLPGFGPHEDAMTTKSWHLAHSLLSPALNLGLLLPDEVVAAVEEAYEAGGVPLNSAEGFIRQVIGWREFVWGIYWLWPDQLDANVLDHRRQLPPVLTGEATTDMVCVQTAVDGLEQRAWVHHIQRLMVLSNFTNLYGVHPASVREWMRLRYIDGAEWVMGPNVMGMGLWADGGRMSTKPYVSGGAYINRMSDYCRNCRFDPSKRTGDDACPFTSLYWDFLARHREHLESNARMQRQYSTMDRLSDLGETRQRAESVIRAIRDGRL